FPGKDRDPGGQGARPRPAERQVPVGRSDPRRGQVTMKYLLPLIWVVLAQAGPQPPAPPVKDASKSGSVPRVVPGEQTDKELAPPKIRHALILCGHPGDADHVKSFTDTIRKLSDGLTRTVGIPAERQHVLFGADRPKDLPGATGPATREAVGDAVARVRKALRPEDGLWVICLGHCHQDRRQTWWNLPGPDMNATEFAKLFADVTCREQVFVMTTSLSGYFVAPLSRRG